MNTLNWTVSLDFVHDILLSSSRVVFRIFPANFVSWLHFEQTAALFYRRTITENRVPFRQFVVYQRIMR